MQWLTTHRGLWRPSLHLASHGAQAGGWDPSELGQFMKLLDGNFVLGKLGGLQQEVLLSWVFLSLRNRRWLQGVPMGLGTASPLPHGIVPQQPLHLRLPPAAVARGIQGKTASSKRNSSLRIIKGRQPFLPGQELPILHSSPRACSLENSLPGTTHSGLNLRMVLFLPRMGSIFILFLGLGHFSEKHLKLTWHLGSEHDWVFID